MITAVSDVGTETPDAATAASVTPVDASLYERLGGIYGIAGAVDALADRLYDNVSANQNPHVAAFHAMKGHARVKVFRHRLVGGADRRPEVLPGPEHARVPRPPLRRGVRVRHRRHRDCRHPVPRRRAQARAPGVHGHHRELSLHGGGRAGAKDATTAG